MRVSPHTLSPNKGKLKESSKQQLETSRRARTPKKKKKNKEETEDKEGINRNQVGKWQCMVVAG